MNVRASQATNVFPSSISINKPCTSFVIGHDSGFIVYNADSCEVKSKRDLKADIEYVEMLEDTNYLAMVTQYGRRVSVWDDITSRVDCTVDKKRPIRAVRLNRERVAVATAEGISLHECNDELDHIASFDTTQNAFGLCCLGRKIMAIPARTAGQVQVVDAADGKSRSIIPAHKSALRALEISPDEALIATASENGTLIRLFSSLDATRLLELRRGVDPAVILSLRFSPDGSRMAVSSDKSTLHIFDISAEMIQSKYNLNDGSSTSNSAPPRPSTDAKPLAAQPHLSSPTRDRSPATAIPIRAGSESPSVRGGSPASDYITLGSSSAKRSSIPASQKYGKLGTLPFLPRMFSDKYSIASTQFELGHVPDGKVNTLDSLPGPPRRGQIGWLDNERLIVVRAAPGGFWEKFHCQTFDDGKVFLSRLAWKRFLQA